MAFTYSANLQGRIALSMWGVPNASLTSDQKTHLDGTWTSGSLATGRAFDAYTRVTQVANWFEQAGATSAPQAWEHWFVAETLLMLAQVYRPERVSVYQAEREAAIDIALDSFTLRDPTGTFASGNLSQAGTVNGIRFYVLNHCARRKDSGANQGMRRRIFPPIDEIDSHIQWVLNFVYNKEPWNFRKRDVSVIVRTVTGISGLTWSEGGKTLTGTGAFTNMLALSGRYAKFLVTGGTGVLIGEQQIASKDSANQITLKQSILASSATSDPTDVTGQLYTVEVRGTLPSEAFDSFASRRLYYQTTQSMPLGESFMTWADPTDMSRMKARYGAGSGMPAYFRTEIQPSDVSAWSLAPFPDANYDLKGAVFIQGPGTPSSETDTAVFLKFPAEFFTVIRDMVLARVLSYYGASDADRVRRDAESQVERLLPIYTDQGDPMRLAAPLDAYSDWAMTLGNGWGPWGNGGSSGRGMGGML